MEETAAPEVAGPPPGAPSATGSFADIVELWWADHFPGSPVAQVNSAWNHAFAAKEELKRRLSNLSGGVL
ncbi:MAG TPA: hypothetical protein VGS13_05770 [Stellaceae bacterium]|nr:hypothetical protein [Stellaceae bacterium]